MAIEKARAYLKQFGLDGRIRLLEDSSATVALAAAAIGCAENRIAKTLSFLTDDSPILVVAAGDAKVDNAAFKAQFHCKAKMIPAEQVEDLIGHAVGGVCPFGINDGVAVYLDVSLKRFASVYPACGASNGVLELSLEELERVSAAKAWVDVCKGWRGE